MERVLEAKLLPPELPQVVVDRPRIEALLEEAVQRRLTSVIAPAGFGKSTLLAIWSDRHRCAWYTLTEDDTDLDHLVSGVIEALRLRVTGLAEAIREAGPSTPDRGPDASEEDRTRAKAHAAHLALHLEDRLASDLVLVLDDLHELAPESAAARFVEALCRQAPRQLHLVMLSRAELPFPTARLRARGQVAEISGAMLAFDLHETRLLSEQVSGPAAEELAARLHDLTLGWPAAVRLGAEAMRDRAHLPGDEGTSPAGADALIDVLAGEVFDSAEPELTELVRVVAPLDGFTTELCGVFGITDAPGVVAVLQRRGLLQAHRTGELGWYSLHPLVRHWARRHLVGGEPAERFVLAAAADWFLEHGHRREALRAVVRSGGSERIRALLVEHGRQVISEGGAEDVLRALQEISAPDLGDLDDPALLQVAGEARHAMGDWDGALECFAGLDLEDQAMPAGAAWRSGLIHHLRGDLDAALAIYEQAMTGEDRDVAMVYALAAAAHWLRGELDECEKLATEAHRMAAAVGEDRALAAAHTALAMVAALAGDRRTNDAHYLRALTHAERAGDVLQLIRIHSNRGSRCLEEGDYAEAVQELDAAISMADRAGYALLRALALTNRGQVMLRLGRLDEARRDLTVARAAYERSGAHMLAYPLGHLGDVHAARGEFVLARAAYEEAVALAEESRDVQGLVPALTGLARILLATDPERAARLADRAARAGPALGHPEAILTQAWVALERGDTDGARQLAAHAADAARVQRDRSSLAESIELIATAEPDDEPARQGLQEAAAAWRQLGQPLDEARVALRLAGRCPDDATIRAEAERGLAVLREAGARRDALLAEAGSGPDRGRARAQVLGAFRVSVGGSVIGPAEWGSRKPRDLLKMLIARRSPVRRDILLEALWPEEDPRRSSRRLSVALSTLRGLLDPDRVLDRDHFVAADGDALWLTEDHWDADLHTFVDAATDGLRRREAGDPGWYDVLRAVEDHCAGEAFEEDAYEDWTHSPREQARALYIAITHALAEHALEHRSFDRAVRLLLRLLERDPYDERAHRGLVLSLQASGRHGEAHRVYQTYCERMEEMGAEPAHYPELTTPA